MSNTIVKHKSSRFIIIQGLFQILPRHWVPHFFFPALKYGIFYSEILDKRMKITVTERAHRLIDSHGGLDSYLLETPEIDVASK